MPERRFSHLVATPAAFLLAAGLWVFPSLHTRRAEAAPQLATPPPQGQSAPEFLRWYQAQRPVNLPVPSNGAVVLIVKFTDVQCPACGLTHEAYKPVLAKYEAQFPGAVRQVTRDFTFHRECNPQFGGAPHEAACEGAIALRLARRKGRGAELEDFLYGNQHVLTPETVRRAASLVGNVEASEFQAGRAAALKDIHADVALARSLGINSTPTFIINGIVVPKVMEPGLLEAVIQYELRKAGKLK